MKRMLASLALVVLAACAGTVTRTNVLLPLMTEQWSALRVQVEREAQEQGRTATVAPVVAKADTALVSDDPVQIASVDWALLDGLVEADIARRQTAGQLGP